MMITSTAFHGDKIRKDESSEVEEEEAAVMLLLFEEDSYVVGGFESWIGLQCLWLLGLQEQYNPASPTNNTVNNARVCHTELCALVI